MRKQAEKLRTVEKIIREEKGPMELFGLFLREDAEKWDVVASSDWARENRTAAIKYIVPKLRQVFRNNEMRKFTRVMIVGKDEEALEELYEEVVDRGGIGVVKNIRFMDQDIRQAYLIDVSGA